MSVCYVQHRFESDFHRSNAINGNEHIKIEKEKKRAENTFGDSLYFVESIVNAQ